MHFKTRYDKCRYCFCKDQFTFEHIILRGVDALFIVTEFFKTLILWNITETEVNGPYIIFRNSHWISFLKVCYNAETLIWIENNLNTWSMLFLLIFGDNRIVGRRGSVFLLEWAGLGGGAPWRRACRTSWLLSYNILNR